MYDLLNGMRVVEAAAFIAGPSAGMQLAQMGAEVIRIDQIGGGPDHKRWPLAPSGDSLYWENLNKGKKSIAIDLTQPEGRELAAALATAPGDRGGLFLTNFPVRGFLSYEALSARRADLVCVRVMGWADGAPALDYTINAAVGVPYMTGPKGGDVPVNHVFPAWDFICGAQAAFAMVAAESARRRTGQGADVRLALSDVAAACLSQTGQLAETLLSGEDRPRMGNDLFGAFGRDFVTADGHRLMLVAITPKQWGGLVSGLGIGDAVAAVEVETGAAFARDEGARFIHRERLFPLFEAAIGARPVEAIAAALNAAGVTWSEYQPLSQAAGDPRLFAGNPMFQTITHPSGLSYPAAGPAVMLAGIDRGPIAPAPRLGAHSDEVLTGLLGLSSGAIGALHDKGVVA
ncbi:CoA transferase [Sphingomonas jatrophae]|uniref:2-methylfumaryl-CoA isomerase n=1 Tax=Sphingomonas jatrophae TaxID=1166337 RepID=A0A1I6KCZ0_9SPHN|nr:CoA transferase [Sphingomonas jatrophae]SFR89165.1 2-methylfumaryl-CoA isomerase [Sphingomonas jatrophae]